MGFGGGCIMYMKTYQQLREQQEKLLQVYKWTTEEKVFNKVEKEFIQLRNKINTCQKGSGINGNELPTFN